jgi:hypothetical protein
MIDKKKSQKIEFSSKYSQISMVILFGTPCIYILSLRYVSLRVILYSEVKLKTNISNFIAIIWQPSRAARKQQKKPNIMMIMLMERHGTD